MYVSHIHVWLCYIDFFWCRGLDMSFMAWLRTGSTGIKETIREVAKNIGIYFKRLVQAMEGEREKTQGLQKKETRKISPKQEKQNTASQARKEEEERQLSTQGPQK